MPFSDAERAVIATLSPLQAPPPDPTNRVADDLGAVALGETLFFDPGLSGPGTVSCATCHDPAHGWADGRVRAEGVGLTRRHSPSVLNTGHLRWWRWDGGADSVWSQALGPIENPDEMAGDRTSVVLHVADTPALARAYSAVFGALDVPAAWRSAAPAWPEPAGADGMASPARARWDALSAADRDAIDVVFARVGKAIGAYERTLNTGETAFDAFARGLRTGEQADVDQLPVQAQRGLKLFIGEGQCVLCHSGPMFSDLEFHNLGLEERGGVPDYGRFAGLDMLRRTPFSAAGVHSDDVNSEAAHRTTHVMATDEQYGQMKTASLRQVADTAPYMHTGAFDTLEAVVRFYSEGAGEPLVGHVEDFVAPLDWSDAQIADVVAFLHALSSTDVPRAPR